MSNVLRDVLSSFRDAPIFMGYLLFTLSVAGVIGLITFDVIDMGMTHFGSQQHRVHDLTFGFIFTTGVVGLLAQLRSPSRNVAGMTMALIPWASLLLAGRLSSDVERVVLRNPSWAVAALAVIVVLLHPTGRGFFRSFTLSQVNWSMLALVGIATVPLLLFASTNIGLQATVSDEHARTGHYGFMAAFSFTVVGVGLLASLRADGWRLTAWVAGLLPALLGLTSLIYPVASSLALPWAWAAIAWGAAFIAAAEFTRDGNGITPSRSQAVTSAAAPIDT